MHDTISAALLARVPTLTACDVRLRAEKGSATDVLRGIGALGADAAPRSEPLAGGSVVPHGIHGAHMLVALVGLPTDATVATLDDGAITGAAELAAQHLHRTRVRGVVAVDMPPDFVSELRAQLQRMVPLPGAHPTTLFTAHTRGAAVISTGQMASLQRLAGHLGVAGNPIYEAEGVPAGRCLNTPGVVHLRLHWKVLQRGALGHTEDAAGTRETIAAYARKYGPHLVEWAGKPPILISTAATRPTPGAPLCIPVVVTSVAGDHIATRPRRVSVPADGYYVWMDADKVPAVTRVPIPAITAPAPAPSAAAASGAVTASATLPPPRTHATPPPPASAPSSAPPPSESGQKQVPPGETEVAGPRPTSDAAGSPSKPGTTLGDGKEGQY